MRLMVLSELPRTLESRGSGGCDRTVPDRINGRATVSQLHEGSEVLVARASGDGQLGGGGTALGWLRVPSRRAPRHHGAGR